MADGKVDADEVLRGLVEYLKNKHMKASDFFRKIDADEGGSVDPKELQQGLKDFGFRMTEEEFKALLSKIDKDGGGDISIREFERAMKAAEKLPKPKRKETLQEPVQRVKTGLTPDDYEDFRQIFCLFKQLCRTTVDEEGREVPLVDWDDSGGIMVDELEQLLETVGMKLNPKELQDMIRDIDRDGNGEIDFEEFCDKMKRDIDIPYEPDDIAASFKAFARNTPEGYIRVRDLKNALKTYMHKDLTDVEVEELLHYYKDCFVRLPGHSEDLFNYQEYIDIMAPMVPHENEG